MNVYDKTRVWEGNGSKIIDLASRQPLIECIKGIEQFCRISKRCLMS